MATRVKKPVWMLIGKYGGMTRVISASGKPSAVMAKNAYTAPEEPRDEVPSVAALPAAATAGSAFASADDFRLVLREALDAGEGAFLRRAMSSGYCQRV